MQRHKFFKHIFRLSNSRPKKYEWVNFEQLMSLLIATYTPHLQLLNVTTAQMIDISIFRESY
jgi:hypothetical protein